jgi:hypothetical protein
MQFKFLEKAFQLWLQKLTRKTYPKKINTFYNLGNLKIFILLILSHILIITISLLQIFHNLPYLLKERDHFRMTPR